MRLLGTGSAFLGIVSLFLLATPCLAASPKQPKDPPPDPSNIVGYRYGTNWWELGAGIDGVELKGFKPEATDDESVEVYHDFNRSILFGRGPADTGVTLAFVGGKLSLIIIRAHDQGKDYKYYRQYYANRLGKCTQVEKTPDRASWLDKDGDALTVEKQPSWLGCATDPPETVIVYLRRHVIQPDPAGDMPEWLDYLINGMGFSGP